MIPFFVLSCPLRRSMARQHSEQERETALQPDVRKGRSVHAKPRSTWGMHRGGLCVSETGFILRRDALLANCCVQVQVPDSCIAARSPFQAVVPADASVLFGADDDSRMRITADNDRTCLCHDLADVHDSYSFLSSKLVYLIIAGMNHKRNQTALSSQTVVHNCWKQTSFCIRLRTGRIAVHECPGALHPVNGTRHDTACIAAAFP